MAGAAEVSAADRSEIQAVIGRQVEAFRQDDAALAFGLAAPTIQAQFGTAENFLAMVRTAYPAVYRPRRFEFRELIDLDGVPAQTVLVVGPDGRPKLAIYPMERLQTGEWRIGGCYLVELPGTDT
ncbi:MAG: DUF4864 domain-containing protein [Alphaproteobacteria bacterium]|nr:DUF4864 domain-containing protein [Alphaproteobacteria bacterium]